MRPTKLLTPEELRGETMVRKFVNSHKTQCKIGEKQDKSDS